MRIIALVLFTFISPALCAQDILLPFKNGQLWGFIDQHNKIVIPPKYESAYIFSDGLAAIQMNGLWGYIDENDKFIISPKYKLADIFENGVALVKTDSHWVQINKKGTIINVESKDGTFSKVSEGLVSKQVGNNYGYTDLSGSLVIDAKYQEANSFCGQYAIVKENEDFLIIDKSGSVVHRWKKYLPVNPIIGNRVVAQDLSRSFLYGLFNVNGDTIVTPKFEWLQAISNDWYVYEEKNKYGFINLKTNENIKPKYSEVYVYGTHCFVKINKQFGIFDGATGKIVISVVYDNFGDCSKGVCTFFKNGKNGIVDYHNIEIVSAKYDDLYIIDSSTFMFFDGGTRTEYYDPTTNKKIQMGYINKQGQIIRQWFK